MPELESGGERPKEVAHYQYLSEDGDLLYEVIRFDPKDFRQRRPDGKGGWIWNLNGVSRVPYRLPEVMERFRTSDSVVLVEGEKDADRLRSMKINATTFAQGANSWREANASWFHDRDVTIIPDNDHPGKTYAFRAAEDLLPVARSVKIIELEDLPEKGDVSDWFDAGHTLEELVAISKATPKMAMPRIEEPPAPAPDGEVDLPVPIDWAAFWTSEAPSIEWILEPFVPAGRQVAVYAQAKLGKSLVVLDGCAAAATGRPVYGGESREPLTVMYIDLEMTEADLRERLLDLGYGPEVDLSHLIYFQLSRFAPFDTKEGGEQLEAAALHYGASLVVIDTMAAAVQGDENDSGTYRFFYTHTGLRLKQHGISLLRVDHMGKDPTREQRGSSAKAGDVDVVWRLVGGEEGLTMRRQHSRIPWVPQEVPLQRHLEPLRHVIGTTTVPAGTLEVMELLERLHVPLDATVRMAGDAIRRETGKAKRHEVVSAALKSRRARANSAADPTTEPPDEEEF